LWRAGACPLLKQEYWIMAHKSTDLPADGLPPGLASPARRALAAAGYHTLVQLSQVKEADLLKLHGMGPKAVRQLREALDASGLTFASPGS
jgi:DNA-directed RNA polymerase alpha subunit